VKPKSSSSICWISCAKPGSIARVVLPTARFKAQRPTISGMLPLPVREERRARFMAVAEAISIRKLHERVGATMQVLVDSAPGLGRKGGVGRSYADAPEIDGVVHLLPPEKVSKTLKVGAFTRARIVGTQGHDLVALPV
jgi:ribosomal protein S12 methylthiotransferase